MAKPVSIPNSFATSTAAIPLAYLDQDFNALANSTNDLTTYSNYVADTGVADAYIANFPVNTNTSTLTAGLRIQFKASNANTGASTLNVQVNSVSIGSGSIILTDGSALPAGSIAANAVVDVIYDGTSFQLLSDANGSSETFGNVTITGTATINTANVTTMSGTPNFTGNVTIDGSTRLNTALSGMVKVTSGNVSTGTAGTDYVAPNVATTFTALQTFTGTSSVLASSFVNAKEKVTISATASTGNINFDLTSQSILYYTSNATANFTVNFRASSGTALNDVMSDGDAVTGVFLSTQGATAYYASNVTVDGASVTKLWQGGTAPTQGNADSVDAYSFSVIKTANATFTVLGSQTQFKA